MLMDPFLSLFSFGGGLSTAQYVKSISQLFPGVHRCRGQIHFFRFMGEEQTEGTAKSNVPSFDKGSEMPVFVMKL